MNALDRPLTPRETEIIGCVARGLQTKEIARDLYISPQTVKNHLKAAYEKMGARNRVEAIMAAARLGLIQLEI